MGRTRISLTTSVPYQDFLVLRRGNRAARLIDILELPKPRTASVTPDGFLRWTYGNPPAIYTPPTTLCFDFARLADGSNEQIRRFAAKRGPLGVDLGGQEHVNDWRRYARLAEALLRFMAEHATGGRGSNEDWTTICDWVVAGMDLGNHADIPAPMRMVVTAAGVNKWYAQARGHVILGTLGGKPQLRPQASNLFGILITQIAHVIAHADQSVMCAGCKLAFTPQRPPSRGARQYCHRCRNRKVPQRDASRDFRRRAKLKNSLRANAGSP